MNDEIRKCLKCGKPLWEADYCNRHLVCNCDVLATVKRRIGEAETGATVKEQKAGQKALLTWLERLNAISINPDMASRKDIAKMAAELSELLYKFEKCCKNVCTNTGDCTPDCPNWPK